MGRHKESDCPKGHGPKTAPNGHHPTGEPRLSCGECLKAKGEERRRTQGQEHRSLAAAKAFIAARSKARQDGTLRVLEPWTSTGLPDPDTGRRAPNAPTNHSTLVECVACGGKKEWPSRATCAACARTLSPKEKSRAQLQAKRRAVVQGYGGKCQCECGCSVTLAEFLTVDHVANDGAAHRREMKSRQCPYMQIIREGFPDRYRLLCFNCNCARATRGGPEKRCPALVWAAHDAVTRPAEVAAPRVMGVVLGSWGRC